MKNKKLVTICFLFCFLFFGLQALQALELTFAAHFKIGTTLVDVEKASGYDPLEEWDTFHYQINIQALYHLKKFQVGVELGFDRLYYFYARVPYGYQTIYRENTIGTTSLIGLFQYQLIDSIFFQGGSGLYFFESGTVLGFMGSLRYHFKITEKISIPAFIRVDVIFGDATPTPFAAGLGVIYHFKK